MNEGTSPILSYNYGARRPAWVRKSHAGCECPGSGYTAIMESVILLEPGALIRIFSSDETLIRDAVPALKQYFAVFSFFMDCQYISQTVFKSRNKKKQAIFFSLLRKVVKSNRSSDLLYVPISPHGNRRCFPRRAGIQCHWRRPLLCDDAVHDPAGVKTFGTSVVTDRGSLSDITRLFSGRNPISSRSSPERNEDRHDLPLQSQEESHRSLLSPASHKAAHSE